MAKLSEKIAIVTGGAGSLGKAVVLRLLSEGAIVIITHTGSDRTLTFLAEEKKKWPNLEGITVDVTSESSVKLFFQIVLSRYDKIDILCNLVGGVGPKKNLEEITLKEWEGMFSVNLNSVFLMGSQSVEVMKKNTYGRIINIAAMPGVRAEAKRGGYGVSKAGVIALTQMAAEEVKEYRNITINAIAPSIILTDENKKWGTESESTNWVTPGQIAEMIVYLCSESGNAINGQIIQMYGKV